jgi:hypothetical protein
VAPRHLDAAFDVEIMRSEIEHRTGPHADLHHVDAAFGKAADQRGFEHSRVGPAITADGDAPGAFFARKRGIGTAERIGIRLS